MTHVAENSLIVPVYKNAESIPSLLDALDGICARLEGDLEVVFVVDGSPDASFAALRDGLQKRTFASQVCLLSRNFGSFPAIRVGLAEATGNRFAVMAADLQEPPELMAEFFETLAREPVDVVVGERVDRNDPLLQSLAARAYWGLYRRLVQDEMLPGGVDVFGCNRTFRDRLLELRESNSSLVGLIMWLGYRRKAIPYSRRPRAFGRSAWSFAKRVRYMQDSIFAFTDLPVRLLVGAGTLGLVASAIVSTIVVAARLVGAISVPGYVPIMLAIFFVAALNSFGLGVIGSYVWRAYENTKGRPLALLLAKERFEKDVR